MIGYKWMTEGKQAFYDGHQFQYGWNEQEGEKGGVCCSGGFHVSKEQTNTVAVATGSVFEPSVVNCVCMKVYYRKKDILGQNGEKVRVRAFKLLRKKPVAIKNDWTLLYNSSNVTTTSSMPVSYFTYNNTDWMTA